MKDKIKTTIQIGGKIIIFVMVILLAVSAGYAFQGNIVVAQKLINVVWLMFGVFVVCVIFLLLFFIDFLF